MATRQTSVPDPSDDNSRLIYIPSAIFLVICPVIVALRVWVRVMRGKMGADDWTAITALIFTLLTSGVLVASCHYGLGRHLIYLEPSQKYEALKYFYISQITYKAAINFTKCSILLLYLRLFKVIDWIRWACWGLLVCVAIYCISSIIATICQCSPIDKAFNKTIPGSCIDLARFWFANAGFSIATDIIILLLPLPLVYQLEASGAYKAALMAVFAIGTFVVVTSCFRVATLDVFATSPDNTYDIANVMWTVIEPNVAVVCSSLPILRPLVVETIPALKSTRPVNCHGISRYGERSGTGRDGQVSRLDEWLEPESRAKGIRMTTIQRSDSIAGSEENILASGQSGARSGIHKTVEYTVHYSDRRYMSEI